MIHGLGTFATIAITALMTNVAHADCKQLKVAAAESLSHVCATDDQLTPNQVQDFAQLGEGLKQACAEDQFAENLARGVLYKSLDLAETCKASVNRLAKSI